MPNLNDYNIGNIEVQLNNQKINLLNFKNIFFVNLESFSLANDERYNKFF